MRAFQYYGEQILARTDHAVTLKYVLMSFLVESGRVFIFEAEQIHNTCHGR